MLKVTVKPRNWTPKQWPLVRITKKFIVVRYNDKATGRFRREDGYEAGADWNWPVAQIPADELAMLNKLADDNGGTYEVKE